VKTLAIFRTNISHANVAMAISAQHQVGRGPGGRGRLNPTKNLQPALRPGVLIRDIRHGPQAIVSLAPEFGQATGACPLPAEPMRRPCVLRPELPPGVLHRQRICAIAEWLSADGTAKSKRPWKTREWPPRRATGRT
jgi:hypothetical protein